jgi:hypothetical protein
MNWQNVFIYTATGSASSERHLFSRCRLNSWQPDVLNNMKSYASDEPEKAYIIVVGISNPSGLTNDGDLLDLRVEEE